MPRPLYNRGVARHRRDDLTGAIADYTACIKAEPGFYWAYLNRGIAHHKNRKHGGGHPGLQPGHRHFA